MLVIFQASERDNVIHVYLFVCLFFLLIVTLLECHHAAATYPVYLREHFQKQILKEGILLLVSVIFQI